MSNEDAIFYFERERLVDSVRNPKTTHIDLWGREWSHGNPELVRSHRESLLTALQVNRTLETVELNVGFLKGGGEEEQQRISNAIGVLPILIRTSCQRSS
jgi:hypothetical protein